MRIFSSARGLSYFPVLPCSSYKLICKVVRSMWFYFKEKQVAWLVSTRHHLKRCFSLLRYAGREDYWCDLFIERCCNTYLNKQTQRRIPTLHLQLSRKCGHNPCRQNELLYPLLGMSLDHLKSTAWFGLMITINKHFVISKELFANYLQLRWLPVASMLTSTKGKTILWNYPTSNFICFLFYIIFPCFTLRPIGPKK